MIRKKIVKRKKRKKEQEFEFIPYHEIIVEPSEDNKSNMEIQFMDDERNIYNLDD